MAKTQCLWPQKARLHEQPCSYVRVVDLLGGAVDAHVREVRGAHVRHGDHQANAARLARLGVHVSLVPLVQHAQQLHATSDLEDLLQDGHGPHPVPGRGHPPRAPPLDAELALLAVGALDDATDLHVVAQVKGGVTVGVSRIGVAAHEQQEVEEEELLAAVTPVLDHLVQGRLLPVVSGIEVCPEAHEAAQHVHIAQCVPCAVVQRRLALPVPRLQVSPPVEQQLHHLARAAPTRHVQRGHLVQILMIHVSPRVG
mmetsp:Transcript_46804/g.114014  ORF Transcript_46804/g.114014 Transcript_46804/m.114014 type:complete len:255 (+) Transcript_46804:218-982(+)